MALPGAAASLARRCPPPCSGDGDRAPAHGVPGPIAHRVATLPPVSSLFAAFLGTNPVAHLLAPTGVLATLPSETVATLTGTRFFPQLIAASFHDGLAVVFAAATVMAVIGAAASMLRGKRFVHHDAEGPPHASPEA